MDDMMSRACFKGNDNMVSEDEEVNVDFYESGLLLAQKRGTPALHRFNENYYEGECLLIRKFLSTMVPGASLAMEDASRIWKKSYKFFQQDKKIWYHIGAKDIFQKNKQVQNVVKDVKQKLNEAKTTIKQLDRKSHESKLTIDSAGPPTSKVQALRDQVEAQREILTKAKKVSDIH